MPGPRTEPGGTEEAALPSEQPLVQGRSAFICAYPESRAFPEPPTQQPVGRGWFAANGLADAKISSTHFRLSRPGGNLHIEDVGSRNGTWVNGQRLAPNSPARLNDGDVVRVGLSLLVYRSELRGDLAPAAPVGAMVGPYGLRRVAESIHAFSNRPPLNVLIEGETGTGKELAAAAVAEALRSGAPYAALNLAAVAKDLFEAQLFGHVQGAFSGASRASPGFIAQHRGGAVFLDEIGELPLDLQPKLLRLLENRELVPVGATKPVSVDVLLVAATNADLEHMVETGGFRRDLWARLAIARLELPPLRERPEDVFPIVQALLARRNERLDPARVETEAVERLVLHSWLSNVRELAAAVEQCASLEPPPVLRLQTVQHVLGEVPTSKPAPLTAETVSAALGATGGNQTRAAKQLGVSRGALLRFMKANGLS